MGNFVAIDFETHPLESDYVLADETVPECVKRMVIPYALKKRVLTKDRIKKGKAVFPGYVQVPYLMSYSFDGAPKNACLVRGYNDIHRTVQQLLEENYTLIAFNSVFERAVIQYVLQINVEDTVIEDPMIFDIMLNSDPKGPSHSLDAVSKKLLGISKYMSYADAMEKGGIHEYRYAIQDSWSCKQIFDKQRDSADFHMVQKAYYIELQFLPIMLKAEVSGVYTDYKKLVKLKEDHEQKANVIIEKLKTNGIPATESNTGLRIDLQGVNFRSPKQVNDTIISNLNIKASEILTEVEMDEAESIFGISLDKTKLIPLSEKFSVLQDVLELRAHKSFVSKSYSLLSKFLDAEVLDYQRIYPALSTYHASGRLNTQSPAIQNLPKGESRTCIVAPEGYKFVVFDLSQIEPRILAGLSQDPFLIDVFLNDKDIYKELMGKLLRMDSSDVTFQQRKIAKVLVLSIIYGTHAYSCSLKLGALVDRPEWDTVESMIDLYGVYKPLRNVWNRILRKNDIDEEEINTVLTSTNKHDMKVKNLLIREYYHSKRYRLVSSYIKEFATIFVGYKELKENVLAYLGVHGYAKTLGGRRRELKEGLILNKVYSKTDISSRASAGRKAVSLVIQGTAAEEFKKICIDLSVKFKSINAFISLFVHDEVCTLCPIDYVGKCVSFIQEVEKRTFGGVPIKLEYYVSNYWLKP